MRYSTICGLLLIFCAGCAPVGPSMEASAAETEPAGSVAAVTPSELDWPWWRGPSMNGISLDANPPTVWSATQNIVWKSPVPGRGHSSPAVVGDRVFVATADEQKKSQLLLCFHRRTGQQLWKTVIHEKGLQHAHEKNTQASPTPACDGEQVYITFLNKQGIWLTATDLEGRIVWQQEAGPFDTLHGYAASPALYKSLVIVSGDSLEKSFLTALDRKTGKLAWRVQRPSFNSFSSPIVARVAGHDQVLLSGGAIIAGYDPATGNLLWHCDGAARSTSGTVAFDSDHVYASGAFPEPTTMRIRADGSGDVTRTHLLWNTDDHFYVPSMVVQAGLVYAVTDNGVAFCLDANSGKPLYKHRLGGDFSASPIIAGKYVFACNEEGRTFVYQAGPKFELVSENELGEGILATPAICGGHIFFRGARHLFCIGRGTDPERK